MSTDDELREAERKGDGALAERIRARLGGDDVQRFMLEVKSEIYTLEQQNREHHRATKQNEERIAFLTRLMNGVVGEACPRCNGHGKLREWIYQDESRDVKCGTCDGRGFVEKK